jgi:hypothetical protein
MLLATIMIVVTASLILSTQSMFTAYGSESSPYESGYDHGCDDAGISNPSGRYINQPEKGPAFHTDEFMEGYNDGFDSCSGNKGEEQPRCGQGYYENTDEKCMNEQLCRDYRHIGTDECKPKYKEDWPDPECPYGPYLNQNDDCASIEELGDN